MNKIFLLISAFTLFNINTLQAQRLNWVPANTINQWEKFLERTQETAYIKLVLICNDGSPICREYKRQQFRGRELASYLNNYFLTVETDAHQEFGQILIDRFDLPGYPMVIYLDANENIIGRLEGYQTRDSILSFSRHVRERMALYPRLREAYLSGGLSMKGFIELVSIETVNHGTQANQSLFDELVKTHDTRELLQNTLFIDLLCRYGADLGTPLFTEVMRNMVSLRRNEAFDMEAFYVNTFNRQMGRAIQMNSEDELQRLINKILPLNVDTTVSFSDMEYRTRKVFLFETESFEELKKHVLNRAANHSEKEKFLLQEALDFMEMGRHDSDMAVLSKALIQESIDIKDEVVKRVYMANAYLLANDFEGSRKQLQTAINMASPGQHNRLNDLIAAVNEMESEHLRMLKEQEKQRQKEAEKQEQKQE